MVGSTTSSLTDTVSEWKFHRLKNTCLGRWTLLVSTLVHVVFGPYCVLCDSWVRLGGWSHFLGSPAVGLEGVCSACSKPRLGWAERLAQRPSVREFVPFCSPRVSFSESVLAPACQHLGNYSVFCTSKQLSMEKYLAIGLKKSSLTNWSMFKFAFTVALLKAKSNLANTLVQNFCWLNINRIRPLELLAERLFSGCFNFIQLIWTTYLYWRHLLHHIRRLRLVWGLLLKCTSQALWKTLKICK